MSLWDQNRVMDDWAKYLRGKAKTEIWGAVALDYYHQCKNRPPGDSPSSFIDWIVKTLYTEYDDIKLFHRVLLSFSVRLLGSDFDRIMEKSLILVRLAEKNLKPGDKESIIADYRVYEREEKIRSLIEREKQIQNFVERMEERIIPKGPRVEEEKRSRVVPENTIRICHISDLHFGGQHDPLVFFGVDQSFKRTDYFINFLREPRSAESKLDLLVISGDITSVAGEDEYDEFEEFLEQIRELEFLPKSSFWERVILIPGNHEVRRNESGGRGDYLKSFQNFTNNLKKKGKVICTPYSENGVGRCVLSSASRDGTPFALHSFSNLGVEILTLVSCFYAQGINSEVVKLIEQYENLKKDVREGKARDDKWGAPIEEYFKKRMYLDVGFFSPDYAGKVPFDLRGYFSKNTSDKNNLRIAVAHHPASKYFEMDNIHETSNYKILLQGLSKLGFLLYLHGHIHFAPRPKEEGLVELASASLSGIPSGEPNGFNIINWQRLDSEKKLEVERFEFRERQYRPTEKLPLHSF